MARGRAGGRPRSGLPSCGSASRITTPEKRADESRRIEISRVSSLQACPEPSLFGVELMTAFDVDLFVIGAGSGGVRAARVAAGYGARVMIAEEYRVGGPCVIRGCVPKKLMVYAARYADDFQDAAGYGWGLSTPTFDWAHLIAN